MTDFKQMFNGNDINAKFKTSKKNTNQQVCSLGRIVTICQYLNYPEIRTRMKATISAIKGVLSVFLHLCALLAPY